MAIAELLPLPQRKKATDYDLQQERINRLRENLFRSRGYENVPLRQAVDLTHKVDLDQAVFNVYQEQLADSDKGL